MLKAQQGFWIYMLPCQCPCPFASYNLWRTFSQCRFLAACTTMLNIYQWLFYSRNRESCKPGWNQVWSQLAVFFQKMLKRKKISKSKNALKCSRKFSRECSWKCDSWQIGRSKNVVCFYYYYDVPEEASYRQ